MFKNVIKKIFGDRNEKTIKKLQPLVIKINEIESEYQSSIKDQNDVLAKTSEFKARIKNGETVDDLLPEAFALVKTACRHLQEKSWEVRDKETSWNMIPYDVQLIGGIVLHKGNIAEMKTGEGKTLVCTLPVYLNALTERGVYVVTVNDYLAQRDAEWMGGLYNYLGLSVGVTIHGQSKEEKKRAYECDITYGTNNEFGFDYLRDNMATKEEEVTQRELHYAIVDEVDSILIDEARTPLIISAPAEESTSKYQQYARLIPQLKENVDFDIDEKSKTASLTDEGISKMEKLLGMENIYTEAGFSEVHHIEQALRSQACYKKDVDYMVKDGEIIIIDEFTGRLMPGRRYSHGLHQAIEAKENVEVKRQSKTLATISFQNYFRLFDKLAGMTGTADTEAEEFYQIYGLDTIVIPTNRPVAREDSTDVIYKSQKGKYLAIVEKIKELNQKGQPVLVGTISVEKSEMLSKLLSLEGVKHNVLNAKQHEREAEIVTNAGEKGSVTIATNMAGRGTDIKLGANVKEVDGLYVLGTERHESRRIDNQLRGRSGRQGDPGASQFFVSMEDELMRLFGADKIKNMMNILKVPEDMPIQNGLISRSIESAQKKVEGRNFDIRKHLVEYDDVMNIHRIVIYKRRLNFLKKEDNKAEIQEMIKETAEAIVRNHSEARRQEEWDYKEIYEAISAIDGSSLKKEELEAITNQNELIEKCQEYLINAYNEKEASLPDPAVMRHVERAVFLRANDTLWMEHIDAMSNLRENVAFSGYAQKDPLTEYRSQGYEMFLELVGMIRANTINTLFKIKAAQVVPADMLARSQVRNMQTNEEEVEATLTGSRRPILNASSGTATFIANEARNKRLEEAGIKIRTVEGTDNGNITHSTMDEENSNTMNLHSDDEKVGRNEPCPCGSGKKYKKCHGQN